MDSPNLQENIFFTILSFAMMATTDTVETRKRFSSGSTEGESKAVRDLPLLFPF